MPQSQSPSVHDHPPGNQGLVEPIRELIGSTPPDLQTPDPDSPRGRILTAALKLFAEFGFDGTSTRAVAEAADVNLAMIHYYFGSKEQLYHRVIGGEIVQTYQSVIHSIPENSPVEETFISLPLLMMTALKEHPVRAALIRREIAAGGAHIREAIRTLGDYGPLKLAEIFQQSYERAVESGRMRKLPAHSVRECLIVIAFSGVFMAPILSVVHGRDLNDDTVWQEWKETWSTLLRQGLFVENS